ncbi:DUF3857 domain-containing protein [Dyadobacter sp. CY312]|uniref:DUF3857 domain-containing protein n=1 Tax=Dyadobacter sp. CY312 TaxID=2907303 RepID=UPI001F15F01C|nr:DUF3857 domain-containing protein [Dyadobacter sp. CY312]MCE7041027.1 DUF3857 and transglutaminase domain-containing protein [Dyadobacter sp. CY312]
MIYPLTKFRRHRRRWEILFVSFLLFGFSNGFAQQDFKPKLGYIDRESLETAFYSADSTAEAVVLYDYGNLRFSYDENKGIVMLMDSWVRIKILKESALSRASVALTYYDGSVRVKEEQIYNLKGYTYNLDNNQIVTSELDKKSIKNEKFSDEYRTTKFNLPNVKKGSVIEYSYTRSTPLSLRTEPNTWRFQGDVPYKWSEYRITIPYFLEYKMTMGGYLPLHINKQEQINVDVGFSQYNGQGLSYRFVVKDAPAFLNEPFITTEMDYLSLIRFELASIAVPGQGTRRFSQTWDQVDRTLDQATWFGGELRKSSYLKEIRDKINTTAKSPEEKMNMAYVYIQKYMKWDGYNGVGSKEGVRRAYDNKKGNASDINLSLITLLRELDLDCNPVVLSTRSHGRLIQEIPMLENFDYVIGHVKMGENEYFLDATQSYAKPGMLPEQVLNGWGRLLPKKGDGKFIELVSKDIKSKLEMINAEIDLDEGLVKGTYSISYGGYEALNWRTEYNDIPESQYQDDLKGYLQEWQIKNLVIKNKNDDLKGTVNVKCDFELEDDNLQEGGFYLNPVMAGRWGSNPLKSKERIYPLNFNSGLSHSYVANFKLPEGYALEETPTPEIVSLVAKAGRFAYMVQQNGNMITVNSNVTLTKTNFSAEEYHDVKEFFERVVQRHSKPLVIRKKTN